MIRLSNRRGFTLLEVLMATAIFSIIGIATVKHIRLLQTTKDTAFEEQDAYNSLRAAISLMRNDLTQAFHVLYDELGEEAKQALQQNQPIAHTIFDGRKNELVFTSLSHRVYYAGVKECDQAEISYFLQPRGKDGVSSLMKRESGIIDSDLFQGGTIYSILDNVLSLEFKYWDEKQGRWQDDWNSDGGERRDRFPLALKMKLSVVGPNKRPMEVQSEFKIAFPNNQATLVNFQ